MKRAYIGNVMVASNQPVVVYGGVRGLVSENRTIEAAQRSLARDQRGCKSQGGYSDAGLYIFAADAWQPVAL
jgi:hypothetical protein